MSINIIKLCTWKRTIKEQSKQEDWIKEKKEQDSRTYTETCGLAKLITEGTAEEKKPKIDGCTHVLNA